MEKIKVEINIRPKNNWVWQKTREDDDTFKNTKMDSHVSKMNTGNDGIIIELVQKQERIQIYNKH